uniref:Uncharacterized protein n=1 Tax=Cucumis melo TaxID=3656 RepID=A0A9I9DN95_CUCME
MTPKVTMVKSIMLVLLLTSSCLRLIIDGKKALPCDELKNQHQELRQLEIEDKHHHHECDRKNYSCWKSGEKGGGNP